MKSISVKKGEIIPAGEYLALELREGQVLRVIDLEGQQVMDLVSFNLHNFEEKLSCIYSNLLNGKWHLTKEHGLYSNRARLMWTIVEDMVGLHHSLGGFCCEELNRLRYGVEGTKNCAANLTRAIAPYGLKRQDLDQDACFNVFMNVAFDPDGTCEVRPPISRPGDFIDLRAQMDCLVALSNCPQERNPCNAFKPTPMKIEVWD